MRMKYESIADFAGNIRDLMKYEGCNSIQSESECDGMSPRTSPRESSLTVSPDALLSLFYNANILRNNRLQAVDEPFCL